MTGAATSIDAARVELLLNELRLPGVKAIWPKIAAQSDKEGWPAARFLATNIAAFLQRLEGALVGGTREQLIAVDQIGKRHRLSPQRADDVPVVDDIARRIRRASFRRPMSALARRDGTAAPERRHGRHAEDAFEAVVEDADAQAMPDQPRSRRRRAGSDRADAQAPPRRWRRRVSRRR